MTAPMLQDKMAVGGVGLENMDMRVEAQIFIRAYATMYKPCVQPGHYSKRRPVYPNPSRMS